MTDREQRVDQIRRAAIPVFASQGFKRTSMADLAEAAGVSRPALYQYFDNRADLFREALQIILVEATDAALAALRGDGLVAERIDELPPAARRRWVRDPLRHGVRHRVP